MGDTVLGISSESSQLPTVPDVEEWALKQHQMVTCWPLESWEMIIFLKIEPPGCWDCWSLPLSLVMDSTV